MAAIRLPGDDQRHLIIGATGSGKTQAAMWHLSHRNFHMMPWIVYNWKRDKSIDSLPGKVDIELSDYPETPGIYVVHPLPVVDDDAVDAQMWEIWRRGNTGVYVDEGYMVPKESPAFRALLTQGRSLHVPMIILSQRPVKMDRFAFSESDFYQIFRLNHRKDQKTVEEFVPVDMTAHPLPRYCSFYYAAGDDRPQTIGPVPDMRTIHSTFARRFARRRQAV